uniref:Uncharacterized protein n=1 Tax=Arundo donax TaxID=35708 RepID=A0A0A9AY14_ARUDO
MSPFLGQTKVEIALPDSSAKEADAESDSNIAGMKTLPTWLLRKAMAITKAEVGNHGSHEEERQIGIKSKRNDGDCGVVEFSASIRRRT